MQTKGWGGGGGVFFSTDPKCLCEYPDETAHKEPFHLDLHCLQMCVRIYLMSELTRLYPICLFCPFASFKQYVQKL